MKRNILCLAVVMAASVSGLVSCNKDDENDSGTNVINYAEMCGTWSGEETWEYHLKDGTTTNMDLTFNLTVESDLMNAKQMMGTFVRDTTYMDNGVRHSGTEIVKFTIPIPDDNELHYTSSVECVVDEVSGPKNFVPGHTFNILVSYPDPEENVISKEDITLDFPYDDKDTRWTGHHGYVCTYRK